MDEKDRSRRDASGRSALTKPSHARQREAPSYPSSESQFPLCSSQFR